MKITSPRHAMTFLQEAFAGLTVEEFWVIALNADKEILKSACLFRGTVDACLFHPRDVFRMALLHNASSLIVAHNHPSGSSRPSREDLAVTRQLLAASVILQIPVVDHLILAENSYFSFLEDGRMRPPRLKSLVSPSGRSPD